MQKDYRALFKEHWLHKLDKHKLGSQSLAEQLKLYIPAVLGPSDNVDEELQLDGYKAVNTFINNDARLLLLLGDSGSGKSLFGQSLINSLWQGQTNWLPIFIHLPSVKLKKNFFGKYLRKKYDLSKIEVEQIKQQYTIFLILDSFDEVSPKYKKLNLYKLAKLYEWNVKVIISCRSDALVNIPLNEHDDIFQPYLSPDQPSEWTKLFLQPFSLENQIPKYIAVWKKNSSNLIDNSLDYIKEFKKIPGLIEMISNPFILWLTMDSLPKLLAFYATKSEMDRYTLTRLNLFDVFTNSWFERQRLKLIDNRDIDDVWSKTISNDFRCYCEQLANKMWQKNIFSVNYANAKKAPGVGLGFASIASKNSDENEWDIFFAEDRFFNGDKNKPMRLLRQGALLKILDNKTFTFLHTSLLEYFAAKRLFSGASIKASIGMGIELNAQFITNQPAMIRLGVDYIKENPEFEEALFDVIEESKYESRVAIAAANAITLLNSAKRSFAGRDLRRIRISNANVAEGNFHGADLRESDLRNVNMSQAWLSDADLSASCMDDIVISVKLQHNNSLSCATACEFSFDGTLYGVLSPDRIVIFNAIDKSFRISIEPRSMLTSIYNKLSDRLASYHSFAFSHNSTQVLIGDYAGSLTLIDIHDRKAVLTWQAYEPEGSFLKSNPIVFVGFGPESKTAYTLNGIVHLRSSIVKCWDLKTAKCLTDLHFDDQPIEAITISHDGRWLYSGTDKIVRWDCTKNIVSGVWEKKHGKSITDLKTSTDGRWLFSSSDTGVIARWGCQTGQCVGQWQAHDVKIDVLSLSFNGRRILSAASDGTIKLWDSMAHQCESIWRQSRYNEDKVKLSPDGTWFIKGSLLSFEYVNCNEHQIKMQFQGHSNGVKVIQSSLSNDLLLSISSNTAILWNAKLGKKIKTVELVSKTDILLDPSGHLLYLAEKNILTTINLLNNTKVATQLPIKIIHFLKITQDSARIYLDNGEGLIFCYDLKTKMLTEKWRCASQNIRQLQISLDEESVILKSDDSNSPKIQMWSIQNYKCFTTPISKAFSDIIFSSDGFSAFARYRDSYLVKISCLNGNIICKWPLTDGFDLISLSPNNQILVGSLSGGGYGNYYGRLAFYSTNDGALLNVYQFPNEPTSVHWSLSDPTLLHIGFAIGILSSWRFSFENRTLQLLWHSDPWGLWAYNCKILGVYGLSHEMHYNMLQYRANVQVSTKSSEDIIKLRNQIHIYNPNIQLHSLFNRDIGLRPNAWALSIARRKSGAAKVHSFLILESIENDCYRIQRIDFVLELRHRVLPLGVGAPQESDWFGQALIEVADKSLFDMQSLVGKTCGRTAGVTPEQARDLLANIRADQEKRVGYSLFGANRTFGFFTVKDAAEHHNCLSWCRKQLELVGLQDLVDGTWIDYPPAAINDDWNVAIEPGQNNEVPHDEKSGEKCIIS